MLESLLEKLKPKRQTRISIKPWGSIFHCSISFVYLLRVLDIEAGYFVLSKVLHSPNVDLIFCSVGAWVVGGEGGGLGGGDGIAQGPSTYDF